LDYLLLGLPHSLMTPNAKRNVIIRIVLRISAHSFNSGIHFVLDQIWILLPTA
jgi:hypothetical protein